MCSSHQPENGADSAASLAHGPQTHPPEPEEYRGTHTCKQCGCRWVIYDLSIANPIESLCREPVKWHPRKCLCHSQPYVDGMLDQRDRGREEKVLDV